MLKKKKREDLVWHFPALDNGEAEGYNDPLLQYFEGDYGKYVAREVIQNSIDARYNPGAPVKVLFEKVNFKPRDVPGMSELLKHLEVCWKKAKKENKEKAEIHFRKALDAAKSASISVLRASDFNTYGLTGEDNESAGRWHRLVRAIGENEMAGVGGGSFGIGKGAPFAASLFRAVYYSTLNDKGKHIFQGKTRLLSHTWNSKEHRGVGFYGIDGYKSVRNPDEIPQHFLRKEQGTDINIIGYNAGEDWVNELAKSILDNFWMAIYEGDLIVSIQDGRKEILIDKATLYDKLQEFSPDEGLIYYRCIVSPDKIEKASLPILGNCRLYIKQDDGFPRDVAFMRKAKMVVKKKQFRALQDAYAGVFICDDDSGNILLRNLEPPEHNDWDEKRSKENGKRILNEVHEWVKGVLKELAAQEAGNPEDIPGLDELLPYDESSDHIGGKPNKAGDDLGSISEETPNEVSAEREEQDDLIEDFIRKPSSLNPGKGAALGSLKGSGGSGGAGKEGEEDAPGLLRINTLTIKFRTIYAGAKKDNAEYCLLIDPLADQEGAINIVAVGEDATVYPVALAYAEPWQGKGKYSARGSFIKGISLKKGSKVKIRVGLKSKAKYALSIESYES